jgi:hypothetical protein
MIEKMELAMDYWLVARLENQTGVQSAAITVAVKAMLETD